MGLLLLLIPVVLLVATAANAAKVTMNLTLEKTVTFEGSLVSVLVVEIGGQKTLLVSLTYRNQDDQPNMKDGDLCQVSSNGEILQHRFPPESVETCGIRDLLLPYSGSGIIYAIVENDGFHDVPADNQLEADLAALRATESKVAKILKEKFKIDAAAPTDVGPRYELPSFWHLGIYDVATLQYQGFVSYDERTSSIAYVGGEDGYLFDGRDTYAVIWRPALPAEDRFVNILPLGGKLEMGGVWDDGSYRLYLMGNNLIIQEITLPILTYEESDDDIGRHVEINFQAANAELVQNYGFQAADVANYPVIDVKEVADKLWILLQNGANGILVQGPKDLGWDDQTIPVIPGVQPPNNSSSEWKSIQITGSPLHLEVDEEGNVYISTILGMTIVTSKSSLKIAGSIAAERGLADFKIADQVFAINPGDDGDVIPHKLLFFQVEKQTTENMSSIIQLLLD